MARRGKKKGKHKPVVPTPTGPVDDVPVTETNGDELTDAEIHFCTEYAYTRNGVQSYMKAFGQYVTNGTERRKRSYFATNQKARLLLQKDSIQAEIRTNRESILKKSRSNANRVIQEIANIALFDPADCWGDDADGKSSLLLPPQMPVEARRAIAGQKVKRRRQTDDLGREWEIEEIEYKFVSKTDALNKLCQRLGITAQDANDPGAELNVIELPLNGRASNSDQVEQDDNSQTEGG